MTNLKMVFATTLAEQGGNGFLGMTECEKYGMAWGCDEDCPVLKRGECKNKESIEMYYERYKNELK